jgi:hypothetical protein
MEFVSGVQSPTESEGAMASTLYDQMLPRSLIRQDDYADFGGPLGAEGAERRQTVTLCPMSARFPTPTAGELMFAVLQPQYFASFEAALWAYEHASA